MRQLGFSLIVMICIITALSTLLLQLYTRSAYALLTVKERERSLQLTYAAHSLMLYAVHIAKHNWGYISEERKGEPLRIDNLSWHMSQYKKGVGTCIWQKKDREHISISAELNYMNYSKTIKCDLERAKGSDKKNITQVIIQNWRTE